MFNGFISIVLPFAIDLVRKYIINSDSKKDDAILKLVQDGCDYLAYKDNNNVSHVDSQAMRNRKVYVLDKLREKKSR